MAAFPGAPRERLRYTRRVDAPLQDKVIVVTGAGRGIGLACATLLGRLGAHLVINDLGCDEAGEGADPTVVAGLARTLEDAGVPVVAHAGDASDPESAAALTALALSHFGRLDGVLARAGVTQRARFTRTTREQRQRVFAVGVEAPLALIQAAHEPMRKAGGGSVVVMTGGAAFQGQRRDLAATMAQAAVVGMVRTAALELRPDGVRVNAVAPTALTRQTADLPLFHKGSARLTADHVAPLVAFLLSDQSRDVSGQVLGIAGSRFFAHHTSETDGYFGDTDDVLSLDDIARHWNDATR